MSRALRIEYENAWYHVMNRGARKMSIFKTDYDRYSFLQLLRKITEKYQIEVHAYCLMGNHYHLLVKTPVANLSTAIQYLDGVYAHRYNKVNQIDGPLFRGRFKSVIIDADSYLIDVSRYIHLNPVKSGMVKKPEDYLWSSCKAYLAPQNKPKWLWVNKVLENFGVQMQSKKYREFLYRQDESKIDLLINRVKDVTALGSKEFIKSLTEKHLFNRRPAPEVPAQRALCNDCRPTLESIFLAVANYYKVDLALLKSSRHGIFNKPRVVAMYLARELSGLNLHEIASEISNITYSGISKAANYLRRKLDCDAQTKLEVDELKVKILGSDLKI